MGKEGLDIFTNFATSANQRIFCGDFNLAKGSTSFREFEDCARDKGLHDTFPQCPPTYGCVDERTGQPSETLLTYSADRTRPKVLDHVFSDRPGSDMRVEPL